METKAKGNLYDRFHIDGQICIITGGAGLMADSHARAVIEGGGIPVLLDISHERLEVEKHRLLESFPDAVIDTVVVDITNKDELVNVKDLMMSKYGHIDILINNAANNPKVEDGRNSSFHFENLSLKIWGQDISVGLTGAFLCAQVFGSVMAEAGKGVILNISSDLGVIAPDQRIYEKSGEPADNQMKKPVTYSVVKHGLIGLTKYLATYWAEAGVRCNAICPAGIENGQDDEFKSKLLNLVPMGRMAAKDEYEATVLYMISDASRYMTGTSVVVDGGRTCW